MVRDSVTADPDTRVTLEFDFDPPHLYESECMDSFRATTFLLIPKGLRLRPGRLLTKMLTPLDNTISLPPLEVVHILGGI